MDQNLSVVYRLSDFLSHPSEDITDATLSNYQKFIEVVKLVVLCFLISSIISSINFLFIESHTSNGTDFDFNDLKDKTPVSNISLYLLFVLGTLFEELEYRLSLKFNIWYLTISLSLLISSCFILLNTLYGLDIYGLMNYPLTVVLAGFMFYPLYCFLFKRRYKISLIYTNKYFLIFYSFACLYGIVHVVPDVILKGFFEVDLIFVVLKFTAIGILIGYARLRYGFLWGILLHFIFNSTAITIGLLIS